ncbi:MAG: PLP-dependent aminotransferase family protein [Roseibium sp.]|uniref:MocR-like pyridoxine biosynthesis transcription factor PdxR n=1 Tax=Roseibium sp. TaxID=1936156 RepID=UPI00262B7A50|nr:PLP-dependent aminotransferase family protein [Roseibium sp.]MCV0426885.1 PLP-dependent aminotransferase family protein [Roseibium sp.]
MTEPVIPEGILSLDRSSDVSLSEQIYRGFRDAVRKGLLSSGTRLPSTRRLAAMLEVGRNTVNAAYDLLQAEGIIFVRTGAAPRIMNGLPLEGMTHNRSSTARKRSLSKRGILMSDNIRGVGWAFRHGVLQPGAPALDCFPYEEWARCLRRAARLERSPDLQYQNYTGLPALRQQLSRHLAAERGVRADPEQILVTSSMQSSLSLLAQALSDHGDEAWLENPGYLGAKTAFHAAGLKIRPLPTDEDGADVAATDISKSPSKLIYVTPSHHYPLGARMPLARRLALLEAARASGAVILEDDYDSEFLFAGRPVAALYGLAEEGQVIYLGTFSKSLMPGLRVAYCVVPNDLVQPLTQLMRNMGCSANVQAQAALAHFMDSGCYQKHLKQIRQIYRSRGEQLVDTLRSRLGNRIHVEIPTGNVQVSIMFRERIDDVRLAMDLQSHGFAVSPLSNCYLGSDAKSGLIIGFAGATPPQITKGVEILGNLIEAVG